MSAKRWKGETLGQRFNRDVKHDPQLRALFKIMFDQENRLRVLEGKLPISRAKAMASLKSWFTTAG